MAPDRGTSHGSPRRSQDAAPLRHADSEVGNDNNTDGDDTTALPPLGHEPDHAFLAARSEQPQFTLRALLCGLLIGVLIAFSNTYFGLQTGWISGMAMPSALIGFAYFKGLRTLMGAASASSSLSWLGGWGEGFSEVENVLVQTVAGSVGTMPLGCGFVGIIPALEFLLKPSEIPDLPANESTSFVPVMESDDASQLGGISLPLGKLIFWALGLCFFGVLFAVPLRKEVIIREKLKFPSGTATALMIGVLHGGEKTGAEGNIEQTQALKQRKLSDSNYEAAEEVSHADEEEIDAESAQRRETLSKRDWKRQIRLLSVSFGVSGFYTLLSYFVPQLHNLPIFGTYLSHTWLWNLNPSPAYIGQGIIMGPATTIHMLFGALLGWAILSPVAKSQGWAKGDVEDWNTGSKGWIVWVSLAIMLADAIVNLGWLVLRPTIWYTRAYGPRAVAAIRRRGLVASIRDLGHPRTRGYRPVSPDDESEPMIAGRSGARTNHSSEYHPGFGEEEEYDAPPEHQIGFRTAAVGLVISVAFCILAVQFSFAGIIPIGLTILAMILAMLLSIMGVRALGETDLNPVSGISKLTQLIFALVTPRGSRNAVTINLLAGAISESGALQAGDLLQDLKTGHLLGASPRAQFFGQLIGSAVGAVVSACVYKLYTSVYRIPGGLFQVPTAYVWVFTARLVTGQGLPPRVPEWAAGAAVVWALLTALRIYGQSRRQSDGSRGAPWLPYVPGGIAVAVGIYNTPSFTLARTAGGVLAWWWMSWKKRPETPMIVLASGLILGEGLLSIVNLGLASGSVPHF